MSEPRKLRIGEVAERTGTTPRTIRYYEEIGLLARSDAREPGAHRLYDDADVERLRELLELKSLLGISLEELREVAAAETARAGPAARVARGDRGPGPQARACSRRPTRTSTASSSSSAGRRDAIAKLEAELVARRRRVRDRLRELEREPEPASS